MANPVYFSATNQYRLKHTLTLVKQEIANNRSYVRIVLQVDKLSGWGFWTSESRPWNIKVDGTTVANGTKSYDFNNYSTLTLGTYEGWVNHGSNGEKTITVSGYFSGYSNLGSATTSQNHELKAIPRGHDFSISPFVIGDDISVNITKKVSAYHTYISMYFGDTFIGEWSEITGGGAQVLSVSGTYKNRMLDKLPTSTSGVFTFRCSTMSGSTKIDTKIIKIKGTVGTDIRPSITSIAASETETKVSNLSLPFVAGISKIKGSASGVSPGRGSEIDSYSWTLDNRSSSAASPTFGVVSKTSATLKLTVTDKRGRSASKSLAVTQLAYAKPSINLFSADRYDAADKTRVNYDLKSSATSLKAGTTEKNTIQYRITRKRLPAGQESVQKDWTSVSGLSVNLTASSLGIIPHDGDYSLFLEVKDRFTTSNFIFALKGTRKLAIEIKEGKRIELHLTEGVFLNGAPLGSGSGGSGASEAWAVTYNNATSSLSSTNVQGAIDEIRGLVPTEMPSGFGDDFLELPNGVKDYYDASTGHVYRNVKSFVIEDADVSLITVAGSEWADYKLVTILATKATDWKWYNVSTSSRPAGSAEIESWEGKTDDSSAYGRNSLFSIFVPKTLYASTADARNALRGKKAYYELATPTTEFVGKFSGTAAAVAALTEQVEGIEDRVTEIENTSASGADASVPAYVTEEADRVADVVLEKRTFQSFVFGAATDLHTNGDDVSTPGVRHAGQAMRLIAKRTQLDLVALLGDYPVGYYDDDQDNKNALTFVRRAFIDSAIQSPVIMLQGNHDLLRNDYGNHVKSKQFYYSYIGANNTEGVFDYPNRFRNYGYIDYDKHKMRVVYLNTADLADVPSGYSGYSRKVSKEQMQWLVQKGFDVDKTDKADWGVIVLSHHPINDDGLENLHRVVGAFKGKKSGSVTIDGTAIAYNFTGTTSEFIAHFHGHNHNFRVKSEVDPTHGEGVLSITIPNACYGRNNEYGTAYGDSHKIMYGDADENGVQRVFKKTANTKDDTAFNVVIVDRGTRKIHCLNYGAGIDREVSY